MSICVTSSQEKWALPTNRIKYINDHTQIKIAMLHEDKKMIPPVWSRITKTPWSEKAKLCGGYGVRIQTSTVSNDAPEYFHSSKQLSKNSATSTYSNQHSLMATQVSRRKNAVKMEASYLLPGGDSIRAASQSGARHKFKAIPMQNKVMFEPVIKETVRAPIQWNSARL